MPTFPFGGTFRAAGVPNARMKGVSGSVEGGKVAMVAKDRRISLWLTS